MLRKIPYYKLLLIGLGFILLIVGCVFANEEMGEVEKEVLYKQNAISISSSIFIGG